MMSVSLKFMQSKHPIFSKASLLSKLCFLKIECNI